ncbi:MAG: hypothetical protein R2795_04250 [Saprospiraceae bacterium]
MKQLFLLFLAISLTALGCKKDEDPALTSENIQGTWNLTLMEQDGRTGLGIAGVYDYTTFDNALSNSTITITFNADGTWTSAGAGTFTSTTQETGADPETETIELTSGIGAGTYTVVDGKLTINGLEAGLEVDGRAFSTKSFSPAAKVELENKIDEVEQGAIFGLDVSVEATALMTLEQ